MLDCVGMICNSDVRLRANSRPLSCASTHTHLFQLLPQIYELSLEKLDSPDEWRALNLILSLNNAVVYRRQSKSDIFPTPDIRNKHDGM